MSFDVDDTDPYPTDNALGVVEDYVPTYKPRNQYGEMFGFDFETKLRKGILFLRHSAYGYDKHFTATNIKVVVLMN